MKFNDIESLGDFVFPNPALRKTVEKISDGRMLGNYIFHGSHGTGKSQLSKFLAWEILNNSLDSNFEPLYTSIQPNTISCSSEITSSALKKEYGAAQGFVMGSARKCGVVILEEFDLLGDRTQQSMKSILDRNPNIVTFITTNNFFKIDRGVVDRCRVLKFDPPSTALWKSRLSDLLKKNKVEVSSAQLDDILKEHQQTLGYSLLNGRKFNMLCQDLRLS